MLRIFNFLLIWPFCCFLLLAQSDSIQLDEVMVTATRTERLLSAVPMPTLMIKSQMIRQAGSTRLQDILGEQAGIVVVPQVNGLGNGIQIQGLNPDYTLILLDGEPLIGRYTGSLELNRVGTFNIKKIEIVKGPSSSLYGSEALAGVINIITDQSLRTNGKVSLRYGSRNTSDLNLHGAWVDKNLRLSLTANHYSTNGYDFSPEIYGQTVSPFSNFSLMPKLFWTPSPKHEIQISARFFKENQTNAYQVINGVDSIRVNGTGFLNDQNLQISHHYFIAPGLKWTSRLYATQYHSGTTLNKLESSELHYQDDFKQQFLRPEIQFVFSKWKKQRITSGTGYIHETVNTSRYGDANDRAQGTYYIFAQHEWDPNSKWSIVSGLRFDQNSSYGSQLSPKLGIRHQCNQKLSFKLSIGSGFKAPDFRQLYLNFDNAAASYAVFGTEVVKEQLIKLEEEGRIQTYLQPAGKMGSISPESSFAINLGMQYSLSKDLSMDFNLFQNYLKGLIETIPVAITTNQKTIYSYTNISRAITQGLEAQFNWQLNSSIQFGLGYQFLLAFDRDVLKDVQDGQYFGRNPETLVTYRIKTLDYFGLPNRSRHHGTFKVNFTSRDKTLDLSARCIYRGKFGIMNTAGNVSGVLIPSSDKNANSILDRYDDFVPGYFVFNLTVSKRLFDQWTIQAVGENLFNKIEPVRIPTLIGRTFYLQIQYSIYKN
ncbi:MAG: TonB-dependent receptor [Saprospiraceae bacterium]|nr:TonB-dependent receptor [Saprospiraceae bacterium]